MMEEFNEVVAENKKLDTTVSDLQRQIDVETYGKNSALERINQLEVLCKDHEAQLGAYNKNLELIESFRNRESELCHNLETAKRERKEALDKLNNIQAELEQLKAVDHKKESETLAKQLKVEKMLKEQAVNKLAEIMNRRDINLSGKDKKVKGSSVELRKKEKECRKLQQELKQERDLCSTRIARAQKECQDVQLLLHEETQSKVRLQAELENKETELEQLRQRLSTFQMEANSGILMNNSLTSLTSGGGGSGQGNLSLMPANSTSSIPSALQHPTGLQHQHSYQPLTSMRPSNKDQQQQRFEGCLWIPNKQNIRRHGWRKQYVVVSTRKIVFYNSEQDKSKSDPALILDLRYVEGWIQS